MRILILGGTRFIGAHTTRRLVELGHRVAVFHRGLTESPLLPHMHHIHGTRKQLSDFVGAFRDFSPEVVLDMLACSKNDGKRLMDLFKGVVQRVVVVSSGDVYRAYDRFRRAAPGQPDPTPLTEDSPLRDHLYPYRDQAQDPDDFFYHYEKILMEQAVMNDPDLPATVLRLPMVYGPGDNQHRSFEYLKRMDDGRPAILISKEMAAWRGMRGYVENTAEAISLCVTSTRAAGRIYHIADRENVTEVEWISRIGEAADWNGRIVALDDHQLPNHLKHGYNPSQDLAIDSTRIRDELGYTELVPPEEAIHRTVVWERANPPPEFNPSLFDYAAEEKALEAASRG